MSLYILKFGGSSVANINRIHNVANIISNVKNKGNNVIVVTSAMQGVTDKLLSYTNQLNKNIYNEVSYYRESDAIVSCGESIAAGILSLALQSIGIKAKSLNGWQIPIEASSNYSNATITNIKTDILFDLLNNNIIPVITGFQGLSLNNDIVTLGRGGSDATACALAYYTKADECYIYTDVSGVFTADPRIVTNAKILDCISYEEMLELAKYGARVLQYKSVLIAKQYKVKVRVLSSFNNDYLSSLVTNKTKYINRNNVQSSIITDNKNMNDIKLNKTNIAKKEKPEQIAQVTDISSLEQSTYNTLGTEASGTEIAGITHSTSYVFLNTKINIYDILDKYEIIDIKNYNYLVKKSILNNILYLLNNYNIDNDIGTITIVGKINKEQNSNNNINDNLDIMNIKNIKANCNCIDNNNETVSISKNINTNNLDNIKIDNYHNKISVLLGSPNLFNNTNPDMKDVTKINLKNSNNNGKIDNNIIYTCYANNTETPDDILNNHLDHTNDVNVENVHNIVVELDKLLMQNNINIKYKFIDNISITYIVHLSQTETVLNIIHSYIYN